MAFQTKKTWYWITACVVSLLVLAGLAMRALVEDPVEVTLSMLTFLTVAYLILSTVIAFELSDRAPATMGTDQRRSRSLKLGEHNPFLFSLVLFCLVLTFVLAARSVDDLVVVAMDFDYIYVTPVHETGETPKPTFLIEPIPTEKSIYLGVVVRNGAPYFFRVCHKRGSIDAAPPKRIALFLVVDGEPQPLNFRYERREHFAPGDRPGCLPKEPKLLGDVTSRERVCAVVEFELGRQNHSEQTCWDFVRERGEDRFPLAELVDFFADRFFVLAEPERDISDR